MKSNIIIINGKIFFYPFILHPLVIDCLIPFSTCGVYVLGEKKYDMFIPRYVGCSFFDLAKRLKSHIGSYSYFCFLLSSNPINAYIYKCDLYHLLGGNLYLENKIHPASPNYMNLECPYSLWD